MEFENNYSLNIPLMVVQLLIISLSNDMFSFILSELGLLLIFSVYNIYFDLTNLIQNYVEVMENTTNTTSSFENVINDYYNFKESITIRLSKFKTNKKVHINNILSKANISEIKSFLRSARQQIFIPIWYTKKDFEKLISNTLTEKEWKQIMQSTELADEIKYTINCWCNNKLNNHSDTDSYNPETESDFNQSVDKAQTLLPDNSD